MNIWARYCPGGLGPLLIQPPQYWLDRKDGVRGVRHLGSAHTESVAEVTVGSWSRSSALVHSSCQELFEIEQKDLRNQSGERGRIRTGEG